MKPTHIKRLQSRRRDLNVHPVKRDTFAVSSVSNPALLHIVTVKFLNDQTVHARCTCPWAQYRGVGCSHVLATLEHLAATKGRTLSFWLDETEARRQRNRIFLLTDGTRDDGVWITSRAN